MAGARIELQTDIKGASSALQRASDALDGDGLALLLSDIGEYMLGATRDRAAQQIGPDGAPWAALSPRYAAHKSKVRPGVPILRFDNHMIGDQLSHQLDENNTALLVGTNAIQGAAQHFGYPERKLPARPWLGVSDADADEILQLTQDHLDAALTGAAL